MHNYSLVLISTFLMAPASSYNFCTHIVIYFVDNWNVSNFTFIPFPVIYGVGYIQDIQNIDVLHSHMEWDIFQCFYIFLLIGASLTACSLTALNQSFSSHNSSFSYTPNSQPTVDEATFIT